MNAAVDLDLARVPAGLSTCGGIAYRQEGAGPPLVLMHGSAGSWRHWARNIPALARVRSVVALDLPGYGDSVGTDPEVTVDSYIDLVADAIVDICGRNGPVDLAGFSFGGQIAAGAAARLGARARTLALLTPSGFGQPTGRVLALPRRRDFDRSETDRREFHRRMLLAMMLADSPSADEEAIDIQEANTRLARFDNRRISWSGRMPALLGEIGCPILLAYGARDVMPYPSAAHRIALCQEVRPDIEVAFVPEAGHWLQYERAAATNRLLTDFLRAAA